MPNERNWKQPAKTLGWVGVGAAVVGGITWLVLPGPTATFSFTSGYKRLVNTNRATIEIVFPVSCRIEVSTNDATGEWWPVGVVPALPPGATNSITVPQMGERMFFRVVDEYDDAREP